MAQIYWIGEKAFVIKKCMINNVTRVFNTKLVDTKTEGIMKFQSA